MLSRAYLCIFKHSKFSVKRSMYIIIFGYLVLKKSSLLFPNVNDLLHYKKPGSHVLFLKNYPLLLEYTM